MPKGIYERKFQHSMNISKAKKAAGYSHPTAVRVKIAQSVKKTIARKKTGY